MAWTDPDSTRPMGKARQILAVTLVATALCADRAASSQVRAGMPATSRPGDGMMSMAGRLVTRLSSNFRRVVPALRLRPSRTSQVARVIVTPAPDVASVAPQQFNPFEFRLPPPTFL